MFKYFVIHKPFNVLSQFSSEGDKKTLKDFFNVPVDAYPVGRLDYDSEGLLILTNDKSLNHLLLDPLLKHSREYWVQVEGAITPDAIDKLSKGVTIKANGKAFTTLPCICSQFINPPSVNERTPPIRVRKSIPDSWIKLNIHEGKNRQVRKMTAAVGHPTLRLIRYAIENINIQNLDPGEMKSFSKQELYTLLNIKM